MSGKHIVFNVEVTSPVHGNFRAGDIGKNIDPGWASDLIAGGYASETTAASAKADAEKAADAAGKLTEKNRGGMQTQKVEHSFSASDLKAQRAAGVVTTGPTDNTVGAEGVAARVAARNAVHPAAARAAAVAPVGDAALAAARAPAARKTKPAAPSRASARSAKTVDKPTRAATSGKKSAGKASA